MQVLKAGKYSLIFADYENGVLENINIVVYDFIEGINIVPQENVSFTLARGDKVMLWYDMSGIAPLCDALELK